MPDATPVQRARVDTAVRAAADQVTEPLTPPWAEAGDEARAHASRRSSCLSLSRTGWEQALANLKAYLGGVELPYQQAIVGPLFGYWREPKEKIAIERTIWIAAPRERVWRAIREAAGA